MVRSDCVFCKIVSGSVPCHKLYEDDTVLAFLDIEPISRGHTLVIPKNHYEKLHECPCDILNSISNSMGKLASAVTDSMNADGYNILCNNGSVAGQLINHMHFHIIPRKKGDVLFGNWPSRQYEDGQAEVIAKKISEKL